MDSYRTSDGVSEIEQLRNENALLHEELRDALRTINSLSEVVAENGRLREKVARLRLRIAAAPVKV